MQEMVTLKAQAPRQMADALAKLAREHERSIAAELRIAVGSHLSKHAPSKKDGAK